MTIATTRDQVRLLIGDIDSTAPEFQDDELDWFLSENDDNPYLAAALGCESLAVRYARAYDITIDGQSMSRGQMSAMFATRAQALREEAARAEGETLGPLVLTRKDGYSDNVKADDIGITATNPRRKYYGQPDAPY